MLKGAKIIGLRDDKAIKLLFLSLKYKSKQIHLFPYEWMDRNKITRNFESFLQTNKQIVIPEYEATPPNPQTLSNEIQRVPRSSRTRIRGASWCGKESDEQMHNGESYRCRRN